MAEGRVEEGGLDESTSPERVMPWQGSPVHSLFRRVGLRHRPRQQVENTIPGRPRRGLSPGLLGSRPSVLLAAAFLFIPRSALAADQFFKTGPPVAGAEVFVDGRPAGTTDANGKLIIEGVAAGPHAVRVEAAGVLVGTAEITFDPEVNSRLPVAVEAAAPPEVPGAETVDYIVDTNVSDAEVFVDGRLAARPFLALELLEGETLEAVLDRTRALAEPEALGIGFQIARVLDVVHRAGIVHRDLTPVARQEFLSRVTMDGSIAGKPPYMSAPDLRRVAPARTARGRRSQNEDAALALRLSDGRLAEELRVSNRNNNTPENRNDNNGFRFSREVGLGALRPRQAGSPAITVAGGAGPRVRAANRARERCPCPCRTAFRPPVPP